MVTNVNPIIKKAYSLNQDVKAHKLATDTIAEIMEDD